MRSLFFRILPSIFIAILIFYSAGHLLPSWGWVVSLTTSTVGLLMAIPFAMKEESEEKWDIQQMAAAYVVSIFASFVFLLTSMYMVLAFVWVMNAITIPFVIYEIILLYKVIA